MAKQAVDIFVAGARRSVDERGRFTVAISGGSTPRRMYKMLSSEPYIRNIPWQKIHIFWVDERCAYMRKRSWSRLSKEGIQM